VLAHALHQRQQQPGLAYPPVVKAASLQQHHFTADPLSVTAVSHPQHPSHLPLVTAWLEVQQHVAAAAAALLLLLLRG
jgi:hypothetical protein